MALIDEKIKRARQRSVVGEVSEEDYTNGYCNCLIIKGFVA